jgi:RNA polymerase sigma-70 factor (ECF subfamily)
MVKQLSDAILLERFVNRREEAAFVALVERHGPLVEGTCRRVLRDEHDVEDVFQVTFLVLARKAAGIPWRESVGGWLCAVAHRLALSTRADTARHQVRETSFTTLMRGASPFAEPGNGGHLPERYHPLADPLIEVERRDLREVLDHELLQLPEKYRAPVVLCDMEGKSHQEAASELGWPAGSMSRRLGRARAILRQRLVYRGVSLGIGLIGCALALSGAWKFTHRAVPTTAELRQAMIPLSRLTAMSEGGDGILAVLADPAPTAELEELIALAHQAADVARRIERHDPGTNRDLWRFEAESMRLSAIELARAARENDRSMMLSAARRLDASCLNCHDGFGLRLKNPPVGEPFLPAG